MKRESFTKIFRMGDKETETTTYYNDGKKHTILCITRCRYDIDLFSELHRDYERMFIMIMPLWTPLVAFVLWLWVFE